MACLVTDRKGLYDSLVTNVSAGLGYTRSMERRRGVVLVSKHGFQPVHIEMGTLSSHASRWLDQLELKHTACFAGLPCWGGWYTIPPFESAKQRQDAGKRDFLDDGVIRGHATVRYESVSESVDIGASPCQWLAAHTCVLFSVSRCHLSCSVTHSHSGSQAAVVVNSAQRSCALRSLMCRRRLSQFCCVLRRCDESVW